MKPGAPSTLRYEADETPPRTLVLGLGVQLAVLGINSVVLVAAIVFRAGGAEESLFWGVFATVLACGAATVMQALRFGRLGAGYTILSGTSSTFIAVCVTALAEGGPAMLSTLVVVSAVIQIALSTRLSLLRRVLTPTVTGTVIMLLPVTVMPILFRMLHQAPPDAPAAAGPVSAFVTIAAVVAIGLKGTSALRLWAPALGVVAGSLAALWFGIYDTGRVAGAPWIGLPEGRWPGLDLDFGPAFWALLPGFVFVTLVGATKSIGVAVAVQRVSWRRPRAVDFRAVQGAVATEGTGNLLAGVAGTMPNTPFPIGVPVLELTGVAARSVGVAAGAVLILLAFVPKGLALILAIPGPVVAATIMVVMAMLFVAGMREVVQSGADYRTNLIAGVSFWTGAGLQAGVVFPEFFAEFAGGLLQNGMTSGGLLAILLTLLTELAGPRGHRFRGRLDRAELARLNDFLGAFATGAGWGAEMAGRLQAASEETVLTLLRRDVEEDEPGDRGDGDGDGGGPRRRLHLTARKEGGGAVLEFIAGAGDVDGNLQDRIALLGEQPAAEDTIEQEGSLRLLRHLASSIRHQQFHNADVVTVRVDAPATARGGS